MDYLEGENPPARQTDDLSRKLLDKTYERLNLVHKNYSEFLFKDMLQLYNLQGMENWPKMVIHPTVNKSEKEDPPRHVKCNIEMIMREKILCLYMF
jgi:hypothetical protein